MALRAPDIGVQTDEFPLRRRFTVIRLAELAPSGWPLPSPVVLPIPAYGT